MKRLLMATMALAVASGAAYAGPNAGGTLILHVNPAIVYCSDNSTYCGQGTGSGQGALTDCDSAVNHVEGTNTAVFFAIAAFNPSSSPRLAGLTFGVNYTAGVVLTAQGGCGDFELATGGWPASGEGTALTWNTARTSILTEAYWFAGYNYYGNPETMCLGPHPTQGGSFADDSIPANLDPIQGYGCLGFNAPGTTPCPHVVLPTGACCLPDFGPCVVATADDCAAQGGTYQGDNTSCQPNPCPPPPPPTGACCVAGAACFITDQAACQGQGGTYQGDGSTCDPDPCGPPVATVKTTWGQIKNNNR